jgi:hypothetical protein
LALFGHDHEQPKVTKIGRLGKRGDAGDEIQALLAKYFAVDHPEQGSPEALVITIPLGTPKRTLLAAISKLIDEAEVPVVPKS